METNEFDVIVIGFGPSGAVSTCLLGQAGIKTLTIERNHTVWDKPRAIAIDHEIMRTLQNIGVVHDVLPYTAPFLSSEHFGAQGQLIRRIGVVSPPYPQGYEPTMVFSQPPVEAILRSRAVSFAKVTVELGSEVIGFKQDAGGVDVEVRNEAGGTRHVRARYVIACDGASSRTRQMVDIKLEDLVFDEPWLVVDVKVGPTGLEKLPKSAAQFCDPGRPVTFIVGPGNHRRWEIMLLPGEDPRAMEVSERVWNLLSPWLTAADGELWRANSYRFHALVAAPWRKGNIFLAGDAAHQQPPFIGQGMAQGIRDVTNLAWKLRSVLLDSADERLLESYEVERSLHVRALTARIKEIGHSICERDPEAARLRDERLIAEGGGKARTITRQDIVPPLEAGLLDQPGREPCGTLFPQPWIVTGEGESRMDDLCQPGWQLIVDGRAGGAHSAVAGPTPIVVGGAGWVEKDGLLARWFDRYDCAGVILRPDHYVYGSVKKLRDTTELIRKLEAAAGVSWECLFAMQRAGGISP